jgi:hypothetical protein
MRLLLRARMKSGKSVQPTHSKPQTVLCMTGLAFYFIACGSYEVPGPGWVTRLLGIWGVPRSSRKRRRAMQWNEPYLGAIPGKRVIGLWFGSDSEHGRNMRLWLSRDGPVWLVPAMECLWSRGRFRSRSHVTNLKRQICRTSHSLNDA